MATMLPKLFFYSVFLLMPAVSSADRVTVEWAPFIILPSTQEEHLLAAADQVNHTFLLKQKGFIRRELVRKNHSTYADIIHWKTKADALSAGEKASQCQACSDYFQLMDMKKSTTAGAGFSHYEVIKRW